MGAGDSAGHPALAKVPPPERGLAVGSPVLFRGGGAIEMDGVSRGMVLLAHSLTHSFIHSFITTDSSLLVMSVPFKHLTQPLISLVQRG